MWILSFANINLRSESGSLVSDSSFHYSLRQTLRICSDSIRNMSFSLLRLLLPQSLTQQFGKIRNLITLNMDIFSAVTSISAWASILGLALQKLFLPNNFFWILHFKTLSCDWLFGISITLLQLLISLCNFLFTQPEASIGTLDKRLLQISEAPVR